jgi:hypothetical protein
LAIGATAIVAGALLPGGIAGADPGYDGSYNIGAAGHGFSMIFGNPASAPYPVVATQLPETQTSLSTGPSNYALASLFWPGPLAANAGGLAGVVLPACSPGAVGATPAPGVSVSVPLPTTACTPSATELPVPVAYANYPVRSESSFPGGHQADDLGPLHTRTNADDSDSLAVVNDFTATGVLTAQRTSVHSHSFYDGTKLVSVGESVINGLNIASGQITIDSLKTVATTTTDGKKSTATHAVTLHGVSVQGRAATIDQNGVHFNGADSNPLTAPEAGANQVLDNFNHLKLWLTKPNEEKSDAGSASSSTGSLVATWPLDPGGNQMVISIGGAEARVQATPALDLSQFDTIGDFGDIAGAASSDTPSALDTSGSSVLGSSVGVPATDIAAPVASGTRSRSGGGAPTVALDGTRASFRRGVPLGPWVLALLLVALIAALLQRAQSAAAAAMAASRTPCPNDRRTTG